MVVNEEKILAVPEGGMTAAGAIVYWNLSGTTDANVLSEAWRERGLPGEWLVELPTPEVAIRRAVREQGEKHRLVRSLANGGWAIVQENEHGEDDLKYNVQLKVKLSATGQPKFDTSSLLDYADKGSTLVKIREEITAAFATHLDRLSREDIGAWLSDLVPKLDAVALRGGGGIYFVPPASMERWESIKEAVREASATRLYEIPAMQAKSAVEAVIDAVAQEAMAAADDIMQQIEVNAAALADGGATRADGVLGSRALTTRSEQLETVRKKVQRYETLLGAKLEMLQERLSDVQASAAAAAMAAHAREQQAQASAA